ncbi:MAG: F0F1 ATP synthase subunit delta [Gammaproteobacteria bacterium]|nr:F0F1 ATP synthase subunit delta [Gammaproteobacteria bacterium]
MQLNLSTFILEIINFLVLIWVLQRIFYKPIKAVIEKRKGIIQHSLDETNKLHEEAVALKSQYENRLSDWQKEKNEKCAKLRQEMVEERAKSLENLQSVIFKEKEKNKAQEARKLQSLIQKAEKQAEIKAAKFASKLLEQFATSDIEAEIVQLFLDQFAVSHDDKIALIKAELSEDKQNSVNITSAFALDNSQQEAVSSLFMRIFGDKITFNFSQDVNLLAGLYVTIGSVIIRANLRDELRFFSEMPFHD